MEIPHASSETAGVTAGFGFYVSGASGTSSFQLFEVRDTGNSPTLRWTYSYDENDDATKFKLSFTRFSNEGSTTLFEVYLSFATWHYIETRTEPDKSGMLIKINGETLYNEFVDNASSTDGYKTSSIRLIPSSGRHMMIDDLYIADHTSGMFGPKIQGTAIYPERDTSSKDWDILGTAPGQSHFGAVADGASGIVDDDVYYLGSAEFNKTDKHDYSSIENVVCNIQSVCLQTDAGTTGGLDENLRLIINDTVQSQEVISPTNGAYTRLFNFYTTDPISGKKWTIESIEKTICGIQTIDDPSEGAGDLVLPITIDTSGNTGFSYLNESDQLEVKLDTSNTTALVDSQNDTEIPLTRDEGFNGVIPLSSASNTIYWEATNVLSGAVGQYYNQHFSDAGVFLAPPSGWRIGDTSTTRQFKVLFGGPASVPGQFLVDTSLSTAEESTDYTITGGNLRTVDSGDPDHTVEINILNTNKWFKERMIVMQLSTAVGMATDTKKDEYHVSIYPTLDPPSLEIAATGITTSSQVTASIPVQIANSITSRDDITVRVRAKTSSDNVQYVLTNGYIAPGETSTDLGQNSSSPTVQIVNDPDPGEWIEVYLDHEPSDRSEENFWQQTTNWRLEAVDYAVDPLRKRSKYGEQEFAGEETTKAPGGGQLATEYQDQVGWNLRSQSSMGIVEENRKYDPYGNEMDAIVQSAHVDGDSTDFYVRESFESEEYSGTLGRKQVFLQRMLFSVYIDPFESRGVYKNSRFIQLNIRNRAPGDLEIGAVFMVGNIPSDISKDSRNNPNYQFWHNGSLQTGPVQIGDHWYGVWERDNRLHPDSKIGIEDENGYARIWVMAVTNGDDWLQTNNRSGNVTGTASSGSNTQLVHANRSPTLEAVGLPVNSVVLNKTDGSRALVHSVLGNTVTLKDANGTASGLIAGLDNVFRDGDEYEIYTNIYGTFTNISTVSGYILLEDSSPPVDWNNSSNGIRKGDEIYNITKNQAVGVDFDNDDFGSDSSDVDTAAIQANKIYLYDPDNITVGWQETDQYELRSMSKNIRPGWEGININRFCQSATNDSYNGQITSTQINTNTGGIANRGILAWGPLYVTGQNESDLLANNKPTPYYGPEDPATPGPGRYWPKPGFWWEPQGGASKDTNPQYTRYRIDFI
jgi:hypothetical protein